MTEHQFMQLTAGTLLYRIPDPDVEDYWQVWAYNAVAFDHDIYVGKFSLEGISALFEDVEYVLDEETYQVKTVVGVEEREKH